MARFTIKVTLIVPDTTGDVDPDDTRYRGYKPTRKNALEYVEDAVSSWGGQRHPTDPFFNTEVEKVK